MNFLDILAGEFPLKCTEKIKNGNFLYKFTVAFSPTRVITSTNKLTVNAIRWSTDQFP